MTTTFFRSEAEVLRSVKQRYTEDLYRRAQRPTPDLARLLGQWKQAYPMMDGEVITSLAQMGLDPASPEGQQIAAASFDHDRYKGLLDKVGDFVGKTIAPGSPEALDIIRQAQENEADGDGGGGLFGAIGGALSDVAGAVGDVVAPVAGAVDTALGEVDETIGSSVRGGIRTGFVVLESGLQEAQTYMRANLAGLVRRVRNVDSITDLPELAVDSVQGALTTGLANPGWKEAAGYAGAEYAAGGGSSARQAASNILRGERVDLGHGYLPGGGISERRRKASGIVEVTVNGVSFGGPGGQALTPGRFVSAFVSEPGTEPFNIVSGLVDAGVSWYGDPALGVGAAAKEAQTGVRATRALGVLRDERSLRAAATELATSPTFRVKPGAIPPPPVLEEVGLVPGVRPTVLPDVVEGWLTKGGRRIVDRIAETGDFYELWEATKRKLPIDLTVKLADASTADEVMETLLPRIGRDVIEAPEFLGFKARRAGARGTRLFQSMPGDTLNWSNLDEAVPQLDAWLRNAKVSPELRNASVERLARQPNREAMVATMTDIMSQVEGELVEQGIRKRGFSSVPARAAKLTQMWGREVERARYYAIDEIAHDRKVSGVMVGGEMLPVQSPYLLTEYLNSGIPLPDARELRRATSRVAPLVDNPFFERTTGALESLSATWKRLALLRGAYTVRVVGEEQIRMGAAGLDSMLAHPISAISALVSDDSRIARFLGTGKIRQADVLGESFLSQAEGALTDYSRALNKGWAGWAGDEVFDRDFIPVYKGDEAYARSWAEGIAELRNDPIARKVAAADGNLDDVKAWFWGDDMASGYRKALVEDIPELADRAGADRYIDRIFEIVQNRTQSDPTLLDVVATGQFGGKRMGRLNDKGRWSFDDDFTSTIDALVMSGAGPEVVKGRRVIRASGVSGGLKEVWDNATGAMFSHLSTKPTNYLSRSQTFRQIYWNRIEEMLPWMDSATRTKALAGAEGVVDSKQLARMRGAGSAGRANITDLRDADELAKAHALDFTKDLLYDMTQKGQFFDVFRLIFPFGEAWKEVVTRWAKLGVENPNVFRRGQQVITAARGNGFFHKDTNGEEVFCADTSTEVLTDRGWLRHDELRDGDRLLSLDPGSDEIRWEPLLSVHRFDFDGDLIRWTGRIDALTTSHHRWLVEDWRLTKGRKKRKTDRRWAEPRPTPAREFMLTERLSAQKQRPIVAGGGTPACFAEEPTHEDELVALVGWVVTEGSVERGGKGFCVTQSQRANPDKTEAIRLLAKHFAAKGYTATERAQRRGGECTFYFGRGIAPLIWAAAPNKQLTPGFLESLTAEQAALLMETLLDGDGHRRPDGYRQWIQQDRGRIDGFQMLAGMLGIRSQELKYDGVVTSSVTLHKVRHVYTTNARAESYTGIVWCPRVSTGTWFARRNGSTYWTGNTYPFSRQLSKALIGIPVDFTGSVSGLSLMTEALPGVGPVVQVPAAAFLSDRPEFDFAREFIFPYGETDYSEGFLESFAPGYLRNVMQFFEAGDDRLFANTTMQVYDYLASTGDYDLSTPEGQARAIEDARKYAKNLYLWRGMAQFFSPTSPLPETLVEGPEGDELLLRRAVIEDYHRLNDEYGYDEGTAQFIERYGIEALRYPQAMAKSIPPVLPVNKAASDWERKHPDIVKDFGLVWGLFAPEGDTEDFDFQAYHRQLGRGERVPLTPEQRASLQNAAIGRHIYDVAKAKVSDKPSKEEREWLSAIRERIRLEYPGYGEFTSGVPFGASTEQVVAELTRAVNDPRLAKTRQADAVRKYLKAREQALAAARDIGVKSLSAQAAEGPRRWLASIGARINAAYPEFAQFYDSVFASEVEDA